jgi:hypothetical protein
VTDPVRQIADAVLYEGYVLWPYRRSALKNQRRWTFGGVYPEAHSRGRDDDPHVMRTDCLLEGGDDVVLDVSVRFLQIVARQVVRVAPGGVREDVDELTVSGERHLTWDEAVEREIACPPLGAEALPAGVRVPIAVAAGQERAPLREAGGRVPGEVVRSWAALDGAVEVSGERVAPRLRRVTVTIVNTSAFAGGDREAALRQTFCSTHTVLRVSGGAFVSLTDPPDALRDIAEGCRAGNHGTWPVLAGAPGERQTLLSSPIILEDHPRIAPESPGDLFDGGEIDQLLTLNILSLTDEEKAEMRASDPRAREILDRTEALSPEELMRLHGTIRELGMARER